MYALFIKHQSLSGRRDELESVWQKHMRPAIEANPGHLAYTYGFGSEADVIGAFQLYRSEEDAGAFVRSPAYLAYLDESRPLLRKAPEVTVFDPRWVKAIR